MIFRWFTFFSNTKRIAKFVLYLYFALSALLHIVLLWPKNSRTGTPRTHKTSRRLLIFQWPKAYAHCSLCVACQKWITKKKERLFSLVFAGFDIFIVVVVSRILARYRLECGKQTRFRLWVRVICYVMLSSCFYIFYGLQFLCILFDDLQSLTSTFHLPTSSNPLLT